MRRLLTTLYSITLGMAALAMVGLLITVLITILSRNLHIYVPGADAYAGYFMAACGSLALAGTLKAHEHVSVTLLLNALNPRGRRIGHIWALSAGLLLSGLFAFYSCKLVWQSYVFMDISVSNDATPLWIPQSFMAFGAVVMTIAFLDELVLKIRNRHSAPSSNIG